MISEVIFFAVIKGIATSAFFWGFVFTVSMLSKKVVDFDVKQHNFGDEKPTALSFMQLGVITSVVAIVITLSVVVVDLLTYLVS